MGFQKMEQDGRIGGQPMDDDMGMDIELSELDLEIMDDEAPVEMNRGGTSMKDYKDVAKNRNIKAPKRTAPRKTHAEIMASAFRDDDKKDNSPAAISARVQARKDKPKNRFEAIRNRLRDIFDGDDEPSRQSKFDFGFSGNPMERAARKYGSPASATKNESLRAGQVAGVYTGGEEPVNNSVRYYDQPFYKRLMEGLGMDEGGLIEDEMGINPPEQPHLIGGEDQFNQPFYAPDQKGGFDMENAYTDFGDGTGGGPLLEMREYMNDAGHRIFITFIDGVPQMEIPAGYYPVEGEGVAVDPTPAIGSGSGGSDMGDDGNAGGIPPELMPTPVNYKELSMEELSQMIEDQKSMKGNILATGIGVLNPIVGGAVKLAMWNETRQLKKELERRRDDPNTSEVDKRRYDQLLEIANAEEPGLISTLLGKITGNDPTATEAGGLDYDQLDKMAKAYTPDIQDASDRTNRGFTPGVDDAITPASPAATAQTMTTPGVDTDRRFTPDDTIAKPAATASPIKSAREEVQEIADELTTPQVRGNTRLEQDAQRRRDRQEANKNITGSTARKTGVTKSATRGLSTTDKKGGAELDSRFGITGLEKGGLATKKSKKKKSK
jgi:hypothetical protein